MHFDWTIRRERNARSAESHISCGFLGPVALFCPDNVHGQRVRNAGKARRYWQKERAQAGPFSNTLFLPLLPGKTRITP
jgi:hypothetical protein